MMYKFAVFVICVVLITDICAALPAKESTGLESGRAAEPLHSIQNVERIERVKRQSTFWRSPACAGEDNSEDTETEETEEQEPESEEGSSSTE